MSKTIFGIKRQVSQSFRKYRMYKSIVTMDKLNLDLEPKVDVYAFRWFILGLFETYTILSCIQWISYGIIGNMVMKYYNVSSALVECSSMVYMIVWPILIFPASYIIDRMGLRVAALIGAGLTSLAASIKVLSVGPDLFYVVMIGQTLGAISQIFILNLPPTIAVTWFPPEEASRVCSFGVFGMSFGTALGFVIPPLIVKDHDDINDIGADLRYMCWGLAVMCLPVAVLVFLYFKKEPEYPPSLAQHSARKNQGVVSLKAFLSSLKALLSNKAFLIHMLAFGCNVGIYAAIGTLLNQLILAYFEDAQEDAGCMGMVMVLTGAASQIVIGIILDKTRKFKESAIIVYIFAALSIGAFLMALELESKVLCYLTISMFGLFLGAYIPVGYEFGIELTFPSPESTVNGILLASSQVISVPLTMALSEINATYGAFYSLLAQFFVLVIGTVASCLTPKKLYRQEAFKTGTVKDTVK